MNFGDNVGVLIGLLFDHATILLKTKVTFN